MPDQIDNHINTTGLSGNAVMRDERVIILPENTLRFTDVAVATDILATILKNDVPVDFNELLYALVCRVEKSLAEVLGVEEEVVIEMQKNNASLYYDVAPKTEFYSILDVLRMQKFVNKLTILYPFDYSTLNIEDDEYFEKKQYDGSYEALVDNMTKLDFTCLVIGDVDLLDRLTKDDRLNFNNKTILISHTGPNHYLDPKTDTLLMRKFKRIDSRWMMDIVTVNLFEFTPEDKESEDDGNTTPAIP